MHRLFLKIFFWYWLTAWGMIAIVLLGSRLTGMRQVSAPNMYATVAPILAAEAAKTYESGGPEAFARFSQSDVHDHERQIFLLDGSYKDVLSQPLSDDGLRLAHAAKNGQLVVLRGHIAAYKFVSSTGHPYILMLYLKSDFRRIDPKHARIILAEAQPRILTSFPEALSRKAALRLEALGVEVRTGKPVTAIDDAQVTIGDETIPCRTVVWTAGVMPSPAGKWLGAQTDRAGRVRVQPDCSVPGHAEIFVIGDTASLDNGGKPLPGVAQVAMQQGRYVGRVVAYREVGRQAPRPFRYRDKGTMAVIGRGFAIVDSGPLKLGGFLAWVLWAFVHILSLPSFGNRLRVWTQLMWSYFTRQRSSQLILEQGGRGGAVRAPPCGGPFDLLLGQRRYGQRGPAHRGRLARSAARTCSPGMPSPRASCACAWSRAACRRARSSSSSSSASSTTER